MFNSDHFTQIGSQQFGLANISKGYLLIFEFVEVTVKIAVLSTASLTRVALLELLAAPDVFLRTYNPVTRPFESLFSSGNWNNPVVSGLSWR
ncbi:MAG: hypothetical protein ACRC78_04125 [Planktothrix sp.]